MPKSSSGYTHRIGRTARAGASGCALTLINKTSKDEKELLNVIQENQPRMEVQKSTDVLEAENTEEQRGEMQPAPLSFDLTEIEGFRYRVEDVSRAVTGVAIKETIAKEVKESVLNSERLQSHFAENPQDRILLEADKPR